VERSKIVTLHEEGYSEKQISEKLKFSKTAIHQPVVKFKTYASFQDLSGGGRPKVTSQRDDHMTKKMVVCSPTTSSKKIRSSLLLTGADVSTPTVKHRFSHEFGPRTCKPTRKPRLTPSVKANRYAFAKPHLKWTV